LTQLFGKKIDAISTSALSIVYFRSLEENN